MYVASKVIQFYKEDCKPYRDLRLFNHKELPIVLSEIDQVTKLATEGLATVQPPGARPHWEKLASKRQTMRAEDMASYSFVIFGINLRQAVIYGEGN